MKLGFIGVGAMGQPMARHLLEAGHALTVHDLRREAAAPLLEQGAQWADTSQQVAQASGVVFTSLPGPREVEAVVLGPEGILEGASPGLVYVDLSTNSPTLTRHLHHRLGERQISMLDSPVSGGVGGAQAGTLALLVGGDETLYQQVRPVLEPIGDKVMYCGPIGCGQICKLVNNYIAISVVPLIVEALTVGIKAGADPKTLYEAIVRSSGNTWQMERSLPRYLFQGNFQPGFMVKLAHKDIRLALELAQECNIPLRLGPLAFQELTEAVQRGYGDLHLDAVGLLQEERAGVQVRASVEPLA